VTSARTDMLLQFDFAGSLLRHYYLREPFPALDDLDWRPDLLLNADQVRAGTIDFRDPSSHNEQAYDRAHVNSVCMLQDGDLLVSIGQVLGTRFALLLRLKYCLIRLGVWPALLSANRHLRNLLGLEKNAHSDLVVQPASAHSALVLISPNGERSLRLLLPEITVPSHSLLKQPDSTVIYLNTTTGEVIHFDPYPGEILSTTLVSDGFLRGAAYCSDHTLVMGSNRELIHFDLATERVLSRMEFTFDESEFVYDIKVLPANFHLPPGSFEKNLTIETQEISPRL